MTFELLKKQLLQLQPTYKETLKKGTNEVSPEAEEAKREAELLRQEAGKAMVSIEDTKPKENPTVNKD